MALSLEPAVRWDFQSASTPLTDNVAGLTLTHSSTSINTTDGLVIPTTGWVNTYLVDPPAALRPSRPFTLVFGLRYTNVNAIQAIPPIVSWFNASNTMEGGITVQTTISQSDASNVSVTLVNGAGDGNGSFWNGFANLTEYVVVAEWTGTTSKLWVNGTQRVSRTGTYTGVFGASRFCFGKKEAGIATSYHFPYAAVYHGQLTAGDLTALGSTFASGRSAIFDAPPPSDQRYRHQRGTNVSRFPAGL